MSKQHPQSIESSKNPARLRRPDRTQMKIVVQCADHLVSPTHPVRNIAAVVEKLDLSGFVEPIKARQGNAGRDATDPQLLVSIWLYGCTRGIGSARELGRRCEPEEGSNPFLWLCGGVSVNHHMLSDFRVAHGDALDGLFTQVIATLVDKRIVKVQRISQDGVRVRVGAGAASFRSEERLVKLLEESTAHVAELRRQLDDPRYAGGLGSRQKAARVRAAREKAARLEQAIAQLPELKARHAEAIRRAGKGKRGQELAAKKPRASTTDAEARVMKMSNGGFNPAANVQLASDTASRAIVGVSVCNEGSDNVGLSEPMRQQVEKRTGQKVKQHLIDGGYFRTEDIERSHDQQVELFIPPKPARSEGNRGHELEPKAGDSPATLAWKARMSSEAGKEIYKQRASTSETINADLRQSRGLGQLSVRGIGKATCAVLWCALAYNLMHFAAILLS